MDLQRNQTLGCGLRSRVQDKAQWISSKHLFEFLEASEMFFTSIATSRLLYINACAVVALNNLLA